MRAILLAPLLLFGFLLPVTPAAAVGTCTGVITTVDSGAGPTLYIDHRASGTVWVYIESNGMAGLQRGGSSLVGGHNEICDDGSPGGPDQLLTTTCFVC